MWRKNFVDSASDKMYAYRSENVVEEYTEFHPAVPNSPWSLKGLGMGVPRNLHSYMSNLHSLGASSPELHDLPIDAKFDMEQHTTG